MALVLLATGATVIRGTNKKFEKVVSRFSASLDYVAGTDPTDLNSEFTAFIAITNDMPYITWPPNLNANGVVRKYTILGKESLTDPADWAPTNSTHRFFKVKVEMP